MFLFYLYLLVFIQVSQCKHNTFQPENSSSYITLYQIQMKIQTKNLLYPVAKIVSLDRKNCKISEGLNIHYNTTLASSQDEHRKNGTSSCYVMK